MPRKPPEGKRFQKGQSGNPRGAAAHNPALKAVRRMTQDDVAAIGQMIVEGNLAALQAVKDDSSASVLKVWFASVAVKAISRGDAVALNAILDRIVGKTKNQLELGVNEKVDKITFEIVNAEKD